MKFGFIGAGKVGFSLGKYLKENNIDLNGYYSKSKHSAKEAAIFTGTKKYDNLEMLIEDSDAIFITTPDGEIQGVWNKINRLSIKDKLICHCSGSISSEIFSIIMVPMVILFTQCLLFQTNIILTKIYLKHLLQLKDTINILNILSIFFLV